VDGFITGNYTVKQEENQMISQKTPVFDRKKSKKADFTPIPPKLNRIIWGTLARQHGQGSGLHGCTANKE